MSEQQQGAPAPEGGAPPAPPAQPSPAPRVAEISMSSDAFNKRLGEERDAHEKKVRENLLKHLEIDSFDNAKTRIGEFTKLDQRVKELEPLATSGQASATLLKQLIDEQFGQLPKAAQEAIDESAKGDTQKRFELMRIAKAMSGAQPVTPPEPAKPPAPANGGPPPAPPPSGAPTKFQEWETMKARNPLMADIFYQSNQREIERTRPAA